MKNWFLITSAINVQYGVFDEQKRFSQTLVTIASIRKRCTNSKIVLIEGSPNPLTQEQLEAFNNTCDIVVDLSQDEFIKFAHKTQDPNLVKHPSEMYLLNSFLSQQNLIKPEDRVYKICGRYYLDSNFDEGLHIAAKNKIVTTHKKQSYYIYDDQTNNKFPPITDYLYETRLYSFCGSLTDYMRDKYKEMFDFTVSLYNNGGFTNLEHVMYKFLNHDKVIELTPIGISGLFTHGKNAISE